MEVSVVITNYNYAPFLERAVRSCYRQKYDRTKCEIIIVDDASTDCSKKVIDQLLLSYSDLHIRPIFNEKNIGLAASRNIGIRDAKGRYITYLDADDYYDEDFLHFTTKYLNTNLKCDIVMTDYLTVDNDENHLLRFNAKEKPIACGIVFRKDVFYDVGMYDESFLMCEEEELMLRLKKKCKIEHLSVPLYRYRRHGQNMTHDTKKHALYKKKLMSKE
jgi:glycosyltransferase involved in cell wall biosynthesis